MGCSTARSGAIEDVRTAEVARVPLVGTSLTFGVPPGWSSTNSTFCGYDTPCLSINLLPDKDGTTHGFPELSVRRFDKKGEPSTTLEIAKREISNLSDTSHVLRGPSPIEIGTHSGVEYAGSSVLTVCGEGGSGYSSAMGFTTILLEIHGEVYDCSLAADVDEIDVRRSDLLTFCNVKSR